MAFSGVKVQGQRELYRAFSQVSTEVKVGMRAELFKVAEPVRPVATQLAQANIRNIGGRWSEFKIGITQSSVYLAPAARRKGGSARPNLGGLLIEKSMLPAVESKTGDIEQGLSEWLDVLGASEGF